MVSVDAENYHLRVVPGGNVPGGIGDHNRYTLTLAAVEAGFAALGRGQVTLPPILSMRIAEHNGEVDVKTTHIQGMDRFAIKISPGFFRLLLSA